MSLKLVAVWHSARPTDLPAFLLHLLVSLNHKDTCRRDSLQQTILPVENLTTRCCHHLPQSVLDTRHHTPVICTHTTTVTCRWEWRKLVAVKFFRMKYVWCDFIFYCNRNFICKILIVNWCLMILFEEFIFTWVTSSSVGNMSGPSSWFVRYDRYGYIYTKIYLQYLQRRSHSRYIHKHNNVDRSLQHVCPRRQQWNVLPTVRSISWSARPPTVTWPRVNFETIYGANSGFAVQSSDVHVTSRLSDATKRDARVSLAVLCGPCSRSTTILV